MGRGFALCLLLIQSLLLALRAHAEIIDSSSDSWNFLGPVYSDVGGCAEASVGSTLAILQPGSTALLRFNGTRVALYGRGSRNGARALITVDDKQPHSFSSRTPVDSACVVFSQIYRLTPEEHVLRISVPAEGNARTAELALDYVDVTVFTPLVPGRSTASVATPPAESVQSSSGINATASSSESETSASPSAKSNSSNRKGIIAVAVIIPLLFVLAILACCFVFKRKQRQRRARFSELTRGFVMTPPPAELRHRGRPVSFGPPVLPELPFQTPVEERPLPPVPAAAVLSPSSNLVEFPTSRPVSISGSSDPDTPMSTHSTSSSVFLRLQRTFSETSVAESMRSRRYNRWTLNVPPLPIAVASTIHVIPEESPVDSVARRGSV